MVQRKLQMRQPAFTSVASAKRVSSEIRQRVLSARQHRQKNLQNQLNVAMKINAVNTIYVANTMFRVPAY